MENQKYPIHIQELLTKLNNSFDFLEDSIKNAEPAMIKLGKGQDRLLVYKKGVERQRELASTLVNSSNKVDSEKVEVINGIAEYIKEDVRLFLEELKKK